MSAVSKRLRTRVDWFTLSRDDQYISLIDSNNQQHRVPLNAIDQINESPVSLMPQDLYKQLSPQELRDLFAYLQCDLR